MSERGAPARCALPQGRRRWTGARLALALVLGGVLGACATPGTEPGESAIGSAPIAAPTIRVGDRWVYHGSDSGSQAPVSLERTVTRINGDQVVMRQRTLDAWGRPEPEVRMRSMSRTTLALDASARISGSMRYADFPLALGKSWEYGYQLSAGRGILSTYRVNARVARIEQVRVRAGVLDAVRIEHEGLWQTPVTEGGAVGTATGRIRGTFWYAPAINGWARIDLSLYRPDGELETRLQQELVRYEPSLR